MGRSIGINLGGMQFRLFTASTTWTAPNFPVNAMVIAVGGGGGGASNNGNGVAGGDTSFGAIVTATGGGGGARESFLVSSVGYALGALSEYGEWNGGPPTGGKIVNPGLGGLGFLGIGSGGGAYASETYPNCWGGNSGAVATAFTALTSGQSVTVTIGAGGAGGGTVYGRNGSSGAVLLLYWPT